MRSSNFIKSFDRLVKLVQRHFCERLVSGYDEPLNRIAKILEYNVLGGKHERALNFIKAYEALRPGKSKNDMVKVYTLAWTIEILQAYLLMADDIMDAGATRRGKSCWYKVDQIGMSAVNDVMLLENVVPYLIDHEFGSNYVFMPLIRAWQQAQETTVMGQMLDTQSSAAGIGSFSDSKYTEIVNLKTSHYSFYLPIRLALILCDRVDVLNATYSLCMDMGYLFQAQDDYLDCYGDPSITGKIGRDIQEGKCTWPLMKTLNKIQNDQRKLHLLKENLGKEDEISVEIVKKIYLEMDITNDYRHFEQKQTSHLTQTIGQYPLTALRPVFTQMLQSLYKRKK